MGLAAPQVGLNLRLMVFNPSGERGKGEELILANPRIVSSTGLESDQEGCLSFKLPGGGMINGDVEARPLLLQHALAEPPPQPTPTPALPGTAPARPGPLRPHTPAPHVDVNVAPA